MNICSGSCGTYQLTIDFGRQIASVVLHPRVLRPFSPPAEQAREGIVQVSLFFISHQRFQNVLGFYVHTHRQIVLRYLPCPLEPVAARLE